MPSLGSLLKLLWQVLSGVFQYRRAMKGVDALSRQSQRRDAVIQAFTRGDYRGGLLLTEELRDKGKPTADYWFYRGAFLLELGTDDAQAEESLRNCIPMQESPQLKALTLSTLALVLIRRERYDEAQRCIEDALLCWPGKGSFFRDLAEISLRRGDNPSVALELASKGVEAESHAGSSEPGVAHLNLAENLATLGWAIAAARGQASEVEQRVDRALRNLDAAVVQSCSQVHYHAGLAFSILGDREKSQRQLRSAISFDAQGRAGRDAKALLETLACHQ